MTAGPVGRLVKKEKLTQEQADAQVDETLGRITGTTDLRGLRRRRLRDRGGAGADGDQAGGVRRARRRDARPRDPRLQHLVAVDHRDRRRDDAARQGRRLPLLLPGVVHAADRDRSRATTPRRETMQAAVNFAQAIRRSRSAAPRCPGFVVNRILNSGVSEIWRDQEESGLSIEEIDEGVGAAKRRADGPVLRSSTCSASTPCCTSPSTCTSPTATASTCTAGMEELVAAGQARRQDGGKGFYDHGEPSIEGDAEPARRARRALHAEGVRRGLPRARGGRREHPRHRPRDDGRRRHDPAAACSAVRPTSRASTTCSQRSSAPRSE